MDYAIRDCQPGDETAWLRCRALAFLDTSYFDAVERSKPSIDAPGFELVAAAPSGELLGVMDVSVDGETATIDTIAVHPDHRSRGIGLALLQEAIRRATPVATTLDAWTRDDPDALRWYRSNGFTEGGHYLHVYADFYNDAAELDRAIAERRPSLSPIKVFLHANLEDEAAMRAQFKRVHVCRRFALELHRF
ncbi:GNAT family N-acetyltransferase [Glycomyces sp. NPDC048151]|uniref:GNAT family N-acetyltransferase n=1 Tax=Glycomyces sp. NPDC048151 TaxID=3364002 RepID=UPI00371DE6DC